MFRNVSFAAVALALLSTAAFASENNDDDIHGRSVASITANLAEYYGIEANLVEGWGDKIVVHARDENGANRVLFISKDTLRLVEDAPVVASRLDVSSVQTAPILRLPADEPARSLLDSDDDNSSSASAY